MDFEKLWKNAAAEKPDAKGKAAADLVKAWAKLLKAGVVRYSPIEEYSVFLIDLSELMIKGLDINPLIVAKPPETEEQKTRIIKLIEKYADNANTIGSLCFVIFLHEDTPALISENDYSHVDIVTINGNDLKKQFDSILPDSYLFNLIKERVPVSQLCPFDKMRPAVGGMFVGRKDELRSLIQEKNKCFLITGSRRIGKSSLMRKAETNLLHKNKDASDAEETVFYINCLTWSGFESSAREIAYLINLKKERRIALSEDNLSRFFRTCNKTRRERITIFFDEFDTMTVSDKSLDWPLLSQLVKSVEEGFIKVVFAGYRDVREISDTSSSPFSEKIEKLTLSSLNTPEVSMLFISPLKKIGIKIKDSHEIVEKVLKASAGQPYLIQFCGEQLFKKIVKNTNSEITPEHVDQVLKSYEYQNQIISNFIENTVEHERLIVLALAQPDKEEGMTEGNWLQYVIDNDINIGINQIGKIKTACQNLIAANIFKYEDEKFKFTAPLYKDVLQKHYGNLNLTETYKKGAFK